MQSVKDITEAVPESVAESVYGLSPLQEGMLFHSLQAPESGVYVEQLVCKLPGALRPELLRAAWERVVQRHDTLRTAFIWDEDDIPRQSVLRAVQLPWIEDDLRSMNDESRQQFLQDALLADRRSGFDVGRAPLMRFVLRRLTNEAYQFVWSFHHLLLDGWSASLLLREVLTLYGGLQQGVRVELEPSIPYSRYIDWLSRQNIGEARRYWTEYLKGYEGPLRLPEQHLRALRGIPADEYRTYKFRICSSEEVRQFTRQYRVTLSTLVHGVWAILLSKYAGQPDVVFGSVVSCRPPALENAESIVGMMINTIPVRVTLRPDVLLGAWMTALQSSLSESRQYDYCRLPDIQAWARFPASHPLFETFVLVENFPPLASMGGARPAETLGIDEAPVCFEQTNFPLGLEVESGGDLSPTLHYNAGRFGHECIRRMAEHYRKCFEALLFQPETAMGELCLLTEAEWRQIITGWSGDGGPAVDARCIHEVFEAQAQRTPEAVAVLSEESQLTYKELNQQSNQLARHLIGLGVRPEVRVGISLERSAEAIMAIMAVVKAGGAYVPLDPAYPRERLQYIAEDSGMTVLITTREAAAGALEKWEGKIVWLDDGKHASRITEQNQDNLLSRVDPENLAYVIYTSGSTGKPKGVMVTHRSVWNVLQCLRDRIEFSAQDRLLWNTTLAFDIAALEILMPLITGATVLVGWDLHEAELSEVVEEITRLQASVIQMTPAGWRLLINAGWQPADITALCGGEALDRELAAALLRSAGRVWNVYGPTETTIWSAAARVEDESGASDIGDLVSGTQLYILDDCLEPVPIGVPGEMFIGGSGLARGYQNRAELTAQKFVPNGFSRKPGERLYRTGDLGAWLPNGKIEFLGRMDHQVKIRGFRIELGEIEDALMEHPEVGQAVVVAREGAPGQKQLVAYLVAGNGKAPSGSSTPGDTSLSNTMLRDHLQRKLPEYMVPGAFVWLPALPLTANGKIDRQKLPAPEQALRRESNVPRTGAEEMLAGIWEQVLSLEHVGRNDNFFEIGGHSLSATLVISRVRRLFGVELPFRALFENPTIASLGKAVQELQRAGQGTNAPPLVARERRGMRVPLSYAQQRLWFLAQLEPQNTAYNMPAAIRMEGHLDVEALEWSFQEVVRRHEILRTRFVNVEGEAFQEIHGDGGEAFALELIDLSGWEPQEREEEERRRRTKAARRVFDLEHGPLVRAQVLRMSEQEHVLLFTMHHIVSDGWSMGVLVQEVGALYQARREGRASPLPELAIQYADYALWQREWLQGEVLEQQVGYWRRQLQDVPMLELPADHPRPAALSYAIGSERIVFDGDLTSKLKALGREEGVTLFMTLLAAFQVLLARYSGQWDIAVGTAVANRNREETEKLIGFFVNTLVLRTDLTGDPDFRQLLERVRGVTLGAYGHQDLPFEKLVEELDPPRFPGRSPFFQVRFMMQNMPGGEASPGELRLRSQETSTGAGPDDLALSVEEIGEQLGVVLEFSTDLFTSENARRMLGHWTELLKSVVSAPEQRISELPLMSEAERSQVLVQWNQTDAGYPKGCIHALFEAQAARTPEAVAVVYNGQRLSYAELNRKANRLAHRLRKLGVGPEIVAGICLERSLDMMVAILGVLKAGGAYLPLDANHPAERLAYMLDDAQVQVLLTHQRLRERLASTRCQILCVDSEVERIAQESAETPDSGVDPSNLAYIIYTSGSTGQPKGVMVQHQGIGNLAGALIEQFQICPDSRKLQFASLGFDASVEEWSTTLLAGAQLVLADRETLLPGAGLEKILKTERISHVTLSPSVLSNLEDQFPDLQTLTVAGEACPPELVSKWSVRTRMVNAYGPTEVTVCASVSAQLQPGRISIGKPINNTQLYVLDERMDPAPVGVPGELYIGGAGLARGYMHRADLTAERFVPNAFSLQSGARLYRTGDVVRYGADGALEFIRRQDEQIKLRGMRIEAGEVEAALVRLAGVKQAAVVLHEGRSGERKLVGYLLEDAGEGVDIGELRRALYDALPDYMVPAALVWLPEFPLTASGKVDRKVLGEMPVRQPARLPGEAPRDAVEEALAEIWSQVLQVQPIGIDDDFFRLGGHSMLTVKLMMRIEDRLHVDLPLSTILRFPTIRGLAEVLRTTQAKATVESSLARIRDGGPEPPLYLVHPGSGQILCYRDWANYLDQAHPIYALQDPLLVGGPRLLTVEELADHYLDVISRSHKDGCYLLAGWSFGGLVAFEMARRLASRGEVVGLLAMVDPTTLSTGESESQITETILLAMAALELDLPVTPADLSKNASELRQELLKGFGSGYQDSLAAERRLDRTVDVLRLRAESMRVYRPQPYAGKIDLLLPEDPLLGTSETQQQEHASLRSTWDGLSAEPVDVHIVPGNHYTMGKEPHVRSLAREINLVLQSRLLREKVAS